MHKNETQKRPGLFILIATFVYACIQTYFIFSLYKDPIILFIYTVSIIGITGIFLISVNTKNRYLSTMSQHCQRHNYFYFVTAYCLPIFYIAQEIAGEYANFLASISNSCTFSQSSPCRYVEWTQDMQLITYSSYGFFILWLTFTLIRTFK